MADISRQQKLASAKKKLKKFQKTKSPENPQKLNKEILNGIQANHFFQTPPLIANEKKGKLIQERPNQLEVNQKLDFGIEHNISKSPATPSVSTPSVYIGGPRDVINGQASEIESAISSYKRSNQQLMEQVNEQRKQILMLQEKMKKEGGKSSPIVEQRALKEQLEVHIQTIGILVSEKSELQSNLSTMQKKISVKDNEFTDLNNQLNTAKQRVVDLEKAISQIQSNEYQLRLINQEIVRERDKFSGQLYEVNHSKEEILLQNSELQVKLKSKVEECALLINQLNELHLKLQKSELIIQQVNTNTVDPAAVNSWQKEKEDLMNTINNHKVMIDKVVADKAELLQKYSDVQSHYEIQFEQFKQQVNFSENEKIRLKEENSNLYSKLELMQQELTTQSALHEESKQVEQTEINLITNEQYSQIQNEKITLERELDLQISENRRLGKLTLEQNEKIEQLETMINQLHAEKTDKSSLLQQIQSDKETISRALQQNKQLKEQLEELQDGFVKMSNNSADLTTRLESEQHGNKDVAEKLSSTQLELEETRMELQNRSEACGTLEVELGKFKEELHNAQVKVASKDMDIDLLNTQLEIIKSNQNNKVEEQFNSSDLHIRLQKELSSAQDIINHLSYQNEELKQSIIQLQEARNNDKHSDELRGEKHEMAHEVVEDDEDLALAKSWEEESTSDSGYTNEALHVTQSELAALQTSVENLQVEREKILQLLQQEREKAYNASEKMEEHLELRMHQQLQQRERELQERYYEQIEALHLKIKTLQEAMEILRRDEDIADFDMVSDGITMPLLKTAFMQLQKRYKTAMDGKANLLDRIEHLEYTNRKLETETETIGEYVALYQTQRQALKTRFHEKDSVISHLSNEHARMQTKVSQLHQLVMQILSERSGIESQNKQLQELVNRRLALQSGGTTDGKEVPALEHKLENLFGKVTVTTEEENELIGDNDITVGENYITAPNDNTTLQILNIFEQLESTGEGYQHGWLSPAARKHQFQPCVNCSENMFDL